MITVIGIGADKGELTFKAAKKIAESKRVFLRSAKTAAGGSVLKEFPHVVPLDNLFDTAENFDALAAAVCDAVLEAERESGSVAYLTDGDGVDEYAAALCARAEKVEFIYGVAQNKARGASPCELRISALDAVRKKPELDTSLALHVVEIDDAELAGDLKLWLMGYYGDETEVTVCVKNKVSKIPLYELDRLRSYDYSCELYVEAQDGFYKEKYCFGDLLRIMGRLTAADGCPWDKAQTHESIRINMLEEAYEAVDAINCGDIAAMTEELGDVLLQAVFHCDMAERFGEFDRSDVITGLCNKLVTRHTHIFGENRAQNADEALGFWEQAKSVEKSYVSTADKLNRLPENFPSLLAAEKVYKKLVKAGVGGAEELRKEAFAERKENSEQAFGKRLFALAAVMADLGIDAETALGAYVSSVKKKFAEAEKLSDTENFLKTI
ncbi:MAG: MazG family protein [Clostridia bacterium]|nr:MazG family protein [Clostridia bacterium]